MDAHAYPVTRTEAEWRQKLTPEQFRIMREHGGTIRVESVAGKGSTFKVSLVVAD